MTDDTVPGNVCFVKNCELLEYREGDVAKGCTSGVGEGWRDGMHFFL